MIRYLFDATPLLLASACTVGSSSMCAPDRQDFTAHACGVFCVPTGYGFTRQGGSCDEAVPCVDAVTGDRRDIVRDVTLPRMADEELRVDERECR